MPVFSRYADFAERANRTVLSDRIENFISGLQNPRHWHN
jgi:hypothetical protein